MNNNYIDLVLFEYIGENGKHLAYAPKFSNITSGTEIVINGKHANVYASATVGEETDQMEIVLKAVGDRLPLPRVEAVVRYEKLKYEEGESNNE